MSGLSVSSTSGSAAPGATLDDTFGSSPIMNSEELTRAFHFSSGNPRIEETRGLMHLYCNDASTSTSHLPVGRKPLVCVLDVPNHMTYSDFCQFCASFIQHILEMRIVRNDGVEDRYCILIRFDDQKCADNFYQHFKGRRFSSLEVEVCCVLFTVDVQYTGSVEHAQTSLASSTEQPTCPVCLERLDQDMGGILTTICNHSFHCSCISKWTDSSCPVCRYCQQQPEKSTCFICRTSENLWMCVICGFVGCGRYKEGHAIRHWKETQHCYSLELETQRVWNYVEDNYVHRLIQSKTDGKLVELNSRCIHDDANCGLCGSNADFEIDEAIQNSKAEAIVDEYNDLLRSQLESQKQFYESLLLETEEETEKEIFVAVKKATSVKGQKMQAKHDKFVEEKKYHDDVSENFVKNEKMLKKVQAKLEKCVEDKKFHDDINENLVKNEMMWKAKILDVERRESKALRLKDEKIKHLEEQLRDLMLRMEAESTTEQ